MQALSERAPGLVVLAVREDGRRGGAAPVCRAAVLARCAHVLVALDHAGPSAAAWSIERPLGAVDAPEPLTKRRARALDDEGWRAVTDAFVDGVRECRAAGLSWALALDDDGLLHDALRHAPARAYDVVRACAPCCALLPIEDLAPGGIDATDGLAHARALVDAGVTRILASAGSRRLEPLRTRAKGETCGGAVALVAAAASAAWLVGRVDAHIEAIVPYLDVDARTAEQVARSFGLARIWVEGAFPRCSRGEESPAEQP